MKEGVFIGAAESRSILAELKELKAMLVSMDSKLDKHIKTVPLVDETAFVTIKALCHKFGVDRKTVYNFRRDYPEIRMLRKMVHEIDFQKAWEMGRKTPLDRKVFNRQNRPKPLK
jgi:hypothetical protein